MGHLREFIVVMLLFSQFLSTRTEEELKSSDSEPCDFAAIFNFGDSNSDTGTMSSAFYPAILPYGETFFHEATGRASDGRLIIDFIAKHLGFPYLSAYVDTIGSNYTHGANFAAGSSTIRRPNNTYFQGGSPFNLEIQTIQFMQFKARTAKFFNPGENSYRKNFPRPEDFTKAIYTFDIGQNDISVAMSKMAEEDFHVATSDMVELLAYRVGFLYGLGARTFWIHNTGPIGCLPIAMPMHNGYKPPPTDDFLDQNGCVNYANDMAKDFNTKLKDKVGKLRTQYPNASLVYVDMYSAKYELISNAQKEGFVEPSGICCGYHENGNHVNCGASNTINGTKIIANPCEDPSKYISWDGTHYTDAANSWIAKRIVNGSFSDPPLPISHSCHNSQLVK